MKKKLIKIMIRCVIIYFIYLSMKVTVKDISSKKYTFETEPSTLIKTVAEEARKGLGIADEFDTIKVIYSGKILDYNKPISEYCTSSEMIAVCMPSKSKPPTAPKPATPVLTPTPSVSTVPAVVPQAVNPLLQMIQQLLPHPTHSASETYTLEQVHAILPVFALFLRNSPELFQLFVNNPNGVVQYITHPSFRTFVQDMLAQSTNIVNAMNGNGNVTIQIPTHVPLNLGSLLAPPSAAPSPADETNSTAPQLTQEDLNNINALVAMGFPLEMARTAYVMTGKNADMAASLLFDGGDVFNDDADNMND